MPESRSAPKGRKARSSRLEPTAVRPAPVRKGTAHLNRGNAAAATRRFDDAVAHFDAAIAVDPEFDAAHNNRGVVLATLGRHDAAIAAYERAIALNPAYPEARFNLGNALQALRRYEDATVAYREALSIRPAYPEAGYNLGNALQALGRHREAAEQYLQALTLRGDYAEAHNNLGNAYYALGRYPEALSSYERARTLKPDSAEAHTNIGNTLQALNRHGEALEWFDKAIALKSDYADPYTNMGNVLMELGRLDEARRAFETAIAIDPHRARLYRNLIDCKQFTSDDPHLLAMQTLILDAASLATVDQIDLHFSLGKALADSGRHDASIHHILRGNALKRGTVAYDEARAVGFLRDLPGWFTAELVQRRQGVGDPSQVPLFVFGMPRSGTTLIEQILASHPKVHGAGELTAFESAVMSVAGQGRADAPGTGADLGLSDAAMRELGAFYVNQVRALAPAAERVTDKMPANFRYAGLIHLALPNARMIHVRRDPVDTCVSCFTRLFEGDQPFSYDLGELGRFYRGYHTLMTHWHRVLPADILLEVRYEDVIADVEREARRVLAHCGLDWDAACLNFPAAPRPVRTASATQVRRPIYRTSIGRWRPYTAMLRPLLEALGPDLVGPDLAAEPPAT